MYDSYEIERLTNNRDLQPIIDQLKHFESTFRSENVSDLIKLNEINRSHILYTLKSRYQNDLIYTSIGPILVALNPFKWINGLYDYSIMKKYQEDKYDLSAQPHVFSITHEAFADLSSGQSQSLIISGESGAGKTETTKQCLNYLAYVAGSENGIQSKILQASPILEAWGNAKTIRNNNSSRFGKYMEIWFDSKTRTIVGSSNTTYILEKSRVVYQERDERNYHVFYQLLSGGEAGLLKEYYLVDMVKDPMIASYLNQSGCVSIEDIDDKMHYREVQDAFQVLGFTDIETRSLYRMIAGILHLGNVHFDPASDDNTEASIIRPSSMQWLEHATELFGIDPTDLTTAFLYRKVVSGGRRQSIAFAHHSDVSALENKNSLVKEIYRRCFDWIVLKINELIEAKTKYSADNSTIDASSSASLLSAGSSGSPSKRRGSFLSQRSSDQQLSMIGILDIFGFEIFHKNSFEQLCINLANEALQQHFNFHIFQSEMDTYLMEDVPVPPLQYRDNQDVLDLIIKKPKGLISVLDEEGMVPRGSWEGFLNKFAKLHSTNPRFRIRSKTKEFSIEHYAGEVTYDPILFLIKNKDTLSSDLTEVFSRSSIPFVVEIFDEVLFGQNSGVNIQQSPLNGSPNASMAITASAPSPISRTASTGSFKLTVGRKFSIQLESLIANLYSTKPRYIRCIKPNQFKKPNLFVNFLAYEQLMYSGIFEAVIIMQNGYPFRVSHLEYRNLYHMLVNKSNATRALIFDEEFYLWFKSKRSVSSDKLVETTFKLSDENNESVSSSLLNHPYQDVSTSHLVTDIEEQYQQYVSSSNKKSAPRIDGGGKSTSRLPSPFLREQCQYMSTAIAELNQDPLLHRCFVGKTRIFFQVYQQKALQNLSNKLRHKSSTLIQKWARKSNCFKLFQMIRTKEKVCVDMIKLRHSNKIRTALESLNELVVRFNKILPFHFELLLSEIAPKYASALELESSLTQQIAALLHDTSQDIADKYDALERLLHEAMAIHFSADYHTLLIRFMWDQNPNLYEYSQQIQRFSEAVRIKRKIVSGIEMGDEIVLEKALIELKAVRLNGNIDSTFCEKEELHAMKIIKDANSLYSDFILRMAHAIETGRVKKIASTRSYFGTDLQRTMNYGADMQVICDPTVLNNLIAPFVLPRHEEDGAGQTAQLGVQNWIESKKVMDLVQVCIELRDLRVLCMDGSWSKVWEKIRSEWNIDHMVKRNETNNQKYNFVFDDPITTTSTQLENPSKIMGILMNEIVPSDMRLKILDEIKDVSLCAITFFIVPKVSDALAINGIPDIPVYEAYYCSALHPTDASPNVHQLIDTSDLAQQIASTVSYSIHFDASLREFIEMAKEHLKLREIVATNDIHRILDVAESLSRANKFGSSSQINMLSGIDSTEKSRIKQSHSDYKNLMKIKAFLESTNELFQALVQDGLHPDLTNSVGGSLRFSNIKIDRLRKVISQCNDLDCTGPKWKELLEVASGVNHVRTILRRKLGSAVDAVSVERSGSGSSSEAYEIALEAIEEFDKSEVIHSIRIGLNYSTSDSSFDDSVPRHSSSDWHHDEVIGTMFREIELYRKEVNHKMAIQKIILAIGKGALRGACGELNEKDVDIKSLISEMDARRINLILDTEAVALLRSCDTIISLRSFILERNWKGIEEKLKENVVDNNRSNLLFGTIRDESLQRSFHFGDTLQTDPQHPSIDLSSYHAAIREEVQLIYDELRDRTIQSKIRLHLQSGQISRRNEPFTLSRIISDASITLVTDEYSSSSMDVSGGDRTEESETNENIDYGRILTEDLYHSVHMAAENFKLSEKTKRMICFGKFIYCLRSVVLSVSWEPENILFFGNKSLDQMTSACSTGMIHTDSSHRDVDKILAALSNIHDLFKMVITMKGVDNCDVSVLTAIQLIAYFACNYHSLANADESLRSCLSWTFPGFRSSSAPKIDTHEEDLVNICKSEILIVSEVLIERRSRAWLLLAAASGKINGTIESLSSKYLNLEYLRIAISFAEETQLYLSYVSKSWLQFSYTLLHIREVVLKLGSIGEKSENYMNFVDQINVLQLQSTIDSITKHRKNTETEKVDRGLKESHSELTLGRRRSSNIGLHLGPPTDHIGHFPTAELQLVLCKVLDLTSTEELMQALRFGGPTFNEGKFDVSRVEYSHLFERLDNAKKLVLRSDRLDRLFFYTELCIMLRTAVSCNQWDLTVRGEKAVVDRTIVTVKRCMQEYEQANRFFRTPVVGVPPLSLIEEFQLVSREWERRLVVQRFSMAFKSGRIQGLPFALRFGGIKIDQLENEMSRVRALEKQSGEVDNNMQVFMQAAREIISLRQEAQRIQNIHSPPFKFPIASNSIRSTLDNKKFIPDAISRAVENIERIRQQTNSITTEWSRMKSLLSQVESCYQLPFDKSELELLVAESNEREYVMQLLNYLRNTNQIIYNQERFTADIPEIIHLLKSYTARREQQVKKIASVNVVRHGSYDFNGLNTTLRMKSSVVLQFVHDSAIVMIHLAYAHQNQLMDPYERYWKDEDPSYAHTPRFASLVGAITQDLSSFRMDSPPKSLPSDQSVQLSTAFSIQAVLRCSSKQHIHPNIRREMNKFTEMIEDLVSIEEMTRALCDPKYRTTGEVGSIHVVEESIAFMKDVLNRIDVIRWSMSNIPTWYSSCSVVLKLKVALLKRDSNQAYQALDDFLTNGKREFETTVKTLQSAKALIATASREEFLLLAYESCDAYWQVLVKSSIMKSAITGKKGCIHIHVISWLDLDYTIRSILPLKNEIFLKSKILLTLSEMARSLRYHATAPFTDVMTPSTDNLEIIEYAQSKLPSRQSIGKYSQKFVNESLTKLFLIGQVNCGGAWTDDILQNIMNEVTKLRTEINDQIAHRRVPSQDLVQVRDVLLSECTILTEHCSHVRSCVGLEDALSSKSLSFTEQGLTLVVKELDNKQRNTFSSSNDHSTVTRTSSRMLRSNATRLNREFHSNISSAAFTIDSATVLQDAILFADAEKWDMDKVEECWWGWLLKTSKSLLVIWNRMVDSYQRLLNQETDPELIFDLVSNPGTNDFSELIPFIFAFLKNVCDWKASCQKEGFRKKDAFPLDISHSDQVLRTALMEHFVLHSLDQAIAADQMLNYCDEEGRYHLTMNHLKDVCIEDQIIANENETSREETVRYCKKVSEKAQNLNVSTHLGKQLVDCVVKLFDFRGFVVSKKWHEAKVSSEFLNWIPQFSSRTKDRKVFHKYIQYVNVYRSLEYAILSCVVPTWLGWTLQSNGRLMAENIQIQSLLKCLRDIKYYHVAMLSDYSSVKELVDVGTELCNLMIALKNGLWISLDDAEIFQYKPDVFMLLPHESVDGGAKDVKVVVNKETIAISIHLKTELRTFARSKDDVTQPDASFVASKSIVSLVASLIETMNRSPLLEPHIKQYLKHLVHLIILELKTVQLEHLSKRVFEDCRIAGNAGELLLRSDVNDQLKYLIDHLSEESTVVNRCISLRQAYQSAKILLLFVKAHFAGDIHGLNGSKDLLLHLNSLQFKQIEMSPEDIPMVDSIPAEDLLRYDDNEFSNLFLHIMKKVSGPKQGFLHSKSIQRERSVSQSKSLYASSNFTSDMMTKKDEVQEEDTFRRAMAGSQDVQGSTVAMTGSDNSFGVSHDVFEPLNKLFKNIFGPSTTLLTDGLKLRTEIRDHYLELITSHCSYEEAYHDYLNALKSTPASGNPGELSVSSIDTTRLDSIKVRLDELESRSPDNTTVNNVHNLHESVECLLKIRRGQLTSDETMITEGIQASRKQLMKERADNEQSSPGHHGKSSFLTNFWSSLEPNSATVPNNSITFFGGQPKKFLVLASREIETADADLKQRNIIDMMTNGLSTPGIPYSQYPFEFSTIQVNELESAIAACFNVPPACHRAVQLLHTCKIVLKLRKLVIANDWNGMFTALSEIEDEDSVSEDVKVNAVSNIDQLMEVDDEDKADALITKDLEINFGRDSRSSYTSQVSKRSNLNRTLPKIDPTYEDEIYAAYQVMIVSIAVENAMTAYHDGKLQSNNRNWSFSSSAVVTKESIELLVDDTLSSSTLAPPEFILEIDQISSVEVDTALSSLSKIKDEWMNEELLMHVNSCQILKRIKNGAILRDWESVYDISAQIMNPTKRRRSYTQSKVSIKMNSSETGAENSVVVSMDEEEADEFDPTKLVLVDCVQKIRLAFEYSSYMICYEALKSSLQNNQLRGSIGSIDISQLQLVPLQRAYQLAKRIGCHHPAINPLFHSAELLFRLRKAILLRHWIADDHTLDSVTNVKGLSIQDAVARTNVCGEMTEGSIEEMKQTVEFILETTKEIRLEAESIFSSEASISEEISLIFHEMLYRKVTSELIRNIHSPGIVGNPGALITTDVATKSLEKAIKLAEEFPMVSNTGNCKWLLRDAKILLDIRKLRLMHKWAKLEAKLIEAEALGIKEEVEEIPTNSSDCRPTPINTTLAEVVSIKSPRTTGQISLTMSGFSQSFRISKQQTNETKKSLGRSESFLLPRSLTKAGVEERRLMSRSKSFLLSASHKAQLESITQEKIEDMEGEKDTEEVEKQRSGDSDGIVPSHLVTVGSEPSIVAQIEQRSNRFEEDLNEEDDPVVLAGEDALDDIGKFAQNSPSSNSAPPLTLPVWNEVKLLIADSQFHICLCEFAKEMTKEENLDMWIGPQVPRYSVHKSPTLSPDSSSQSSQTYSNRISPSSGTRRGSNTLRGGTGISNPIGTTKPVDISRITVMSEILKLTINTAKAHPSTEFDRLIEAQKA